MMEHQHVTYMAKANLVKLPTRLDTQLQRILTCEADVEAELADKDYITGYSRGLATVELLEVCNSFGEMLNIR